MLILGVDLTRRESVGGRDGGQEGEREGGREGGREGSREGGRGAGRTGGKEGGARRMLPRHYGDGAAAARKQRRQLGQL